MADLPGAGANTENATESGRCSASTKAVFALDMIALAEGTPVRAAVLFRQQFLLRARRRRWADGGDP